MNRLNSRDEINRLVRIEQLTDYCIVAPIAPSQIAGLDTLPLRLYTVRKVSISVEAGCCVGAYQVVRWRDAGLFIPPKHGTFGWGTIRAR